MNKIDCKALYNEVVREIKMETETLSSAPHFYVYLIQDENGAVDHGSERYVMLKNQTAVECGLNCHIRRLTAKQFAEEIIALSLNPIPVKAMLQLPAPKVCVELFEDAVKDGHIIDVDHLGSDVLDNMWDGDFNRQPATPRGIVALLVDELGSLEGKKVAVVGSRSKTTGRFLIPTLQHLNATVSMYHSRSKLRDNEFDMYDIVISCVGSPGMIQQKHLGSGEKTLIDVGVSVVNGKVCGDFDIDVRESNRYTPYVGGVGLITRSFLMRNVMDCHYNFLSRKRRFRPTVRMSYSS